jgi:hypothetical protein
MTKTKNKKKTTPDQPAAVLFIQRRAGLFYALLLLIVAAASYAIWARQMGFYWDEWAYVWISQKLGDAGLARYFATNRPFWGMIYRLTLPLMGYEPWRWQIFGLFWRWLCAVLLFNVVRTTWPERSEVAAAAGLLFLVYPGFDQQPIALMFGHFFLVLAALLFSLLLMQLAQRRSGRFFWLFTLLGMAASLLNLLAMEYFLVLDLIRLPLLWIIKGETTPTWQQRIKKTLLAWLPYAMVFGGIGIWRAFFFKFQTQNYHPVLLEGLKTAPLDTLSTLLLTVLSDLFKVSVQAWSKAFLPPAVDELGKSGLLTFALAASLAGLLVVSWFYWLKPKNELSRNTASEMLLVALAGLLLGGVPFWLTGLPVGLVYQTSRFTLPFTFGACLLLAVIIWLLPGRQPLRVALLAVLVACSAGMQVQVGNDYRRDWAQQSALFWQMSWRMPAIQPGTALVINDFPMQHVSDNSLSAPINAIYAPDNHSQDMAYMLYFASLRGDTYFKGFTPGQNITHSYLAATFHGSSDQLLALDYEPPACLSILDAGVDPANALLTTDMRAAAVLSAQKNILAAPQHQPPPAIFGSEPPHGWCFYFEQASLARQLQNWPQVASLGDTAFALKDYPNGPLERLPFIEGYAHVGRWKDALKLSQDTARISSVTHPPLCSLWKRINQETQPSPEKAQAQTGIKDFLTCEP